MDSRYLDTLKERVLIFDGAMGTAIQALNLTAEDFGGPHLEGCNDHLVLTRPDAIANIHAGYLEAGCDVVETNTFRANRITLGEYKLGDKVLEINRVAAQLARSVADRFSMPDQPRFVAGSIGPSGLLISSDDPVMSNITFEALVDVFAEQSQGLIEGGVDLLVIETSQDILEVKAVIFGAHKAMQETGRKVPIQAQVTLDTSGRMLLGTDIAAALTTLEALDVNIIGLNCSTGPDYMRDPIRYLCENSHLPVSCIPNAGLPLNVNGQAVYPMEPGPLADTLKEFVEEFGVSVVGGCCGTHAEHIRELVKAIGRRAPKPRTVPKVARVSSAMRASTTVQEPRPTLVGERVNSQGSRKVKRLLLADDYDGLLMVAREQQESGAHMLDIITALTERTDEAEQMRKLVKKLSNGVELPLVIDTTEADVVKAALEASPGRVVISSVNMERGRERIDRYLPHVKAHGAAVVAMTIDEEGMAHTAAKKAEIAKRIYDIIVGEYGLTSDSLIYDAMVFPVSTGQEELKRDALETIEGLRRIKAELPGVMTLLGISNVSFGLTPRARATLNSVFLYHCVQAGLDMAIVNPAHITPYAEIPQDERTLAEDLIYDRDPDALPRYIAHFEALGGELETSKDKEDSELAQMTVEQRIHWQILHRKKDGIEAMLDDAMTRHDPVWVLNNVLLPAMKDVGDRFGAGELILPFVLQSAEVMKKAVAHLEQFLEKKEGYTKGRVVLATVYGDVHDIGKNLVNTILSNNGYTVYDLGKQVPINTIIDKAVEVNATAIGLSALLVSTSKQMPLCVQELHKRRLHFPVMIGGAAINRRYGRRILFVDGQGTPYEPGVFYCKDAFEGLDTMDKLTDPIESENILQRILDEGQAFLKGMDEQPQVNGNGSKPAIQRSDVRTDTPVPQPPFWGTRVLNKIPLQYVFECLDLDSLYRLSWGAKNKRGTEWARLLETEFEPRLEAMKREALLHPYMFPQAVYGYFPANSDRDTVIVYDPQNPARELTRFTFPRQPGNRHLCLADYFAAVGSGRKDLIAFQAVTIGEATTHKVDQLQAAGDYSAAYFTHGLSVEITDAIAEYVHRHIRQELGLPAGQGKRYSWGYPACPDLADHEKVFKLLPVDEIGLSLTAAFQLLPEQSTVALVAHHPQATYFGTAAQRETREAAAATVAA